MIIDTHVHIGGDAAGFSMTEEMVLEMLEKYHIDYAMVSNADAVEVDHNQEVIPKEWQVTQEEALRRVLAFAEANPKKIGAAVWVKPLLEGVTEELETLIQEHLNCIHAIKLHPYHSKIKPTDPKVLPYLKLAEKYHLAVVSHTGGCPEADPVHVYEAAKRFPTVPFVMVHMGLGTDNREALELLGKQDNLYGDTTWVPVTTTIEAVQRFGSGKMMFGTDAPIDGVDTYKCNPKGERSVYPDYFELLSDKIGKAAYEDVMSENAKRILHII